MNFPTFILASASPRRTELLRELGLEFEIMPSHVPEVENEHLTAAELSQINAYRKARAVSKKLPDALVLGVDTVVTLKNKCYGKLATYAEAMQFLKELQGKTHEVVSGVCLTHLRAHRQSIFADRTFVTFKKLTEKQIRQYLEQINPLDKAGGYAIQEHGDQIVEKTEGSFSNVVGLPMEKLKTQLELFSPQLTH